MGIFHFKHFQLQQNHAALKVGTDAMVLGALCDFTDATSLLDIGTGTGVLALMCAQRFQLEVLDAIEPSENARKDAVFNFQNNPFLPKIELYPSALQSFNKQVYDGLICNPPYFENATKNINEDKLRARHNDHLPLSDLAFHCGRLLSQTGKIWLVYPYSQCNQLLTAFSINGLHCSQEITVYGKPDNPVRVICCFSKTPAEKIKTQFQVRDTLGNYTKEYIDLTRDFHNRTL